MFDPHVPNFVGWTAPGTDRCASVDYAGLANAAIVANDGASLGTETSGTVVERSLPDGRAEVTVLLHTTNALTYVTGFSDCFSELRGPLFFGHTASEVLAGAAPALGESFLQLVFLSTAPGARLPDLVQLAFVPEPRQELRFISFRARADGPLRPAFGVPNGTPGRVTVIETGLLMTPFMGAVADGFPVENITLNVVAQ